MSAQDFYNRLSGSLQLRDRHLESERTVLTYREERVEELEIEISKHRRAISLLELCITEQVSVKEEIEKIGTLILQAMFDDTYSYKLDPVVDGDGVLKGLNPVVYEHGRAKKPLRNGGGVRSALSLTNRIIFVLVDPTLAPVVFWDEFGAEIDREKFPLLMDVIADLQKERELQIIMITHYGQGFEQIFDVSRPGKVSVVKERKLNANQVND